MKTNGGFLLQSSLKLVLAFTICFGDVTAQDSTKQAATALQVLPRIHSAGYFPFSGAYLNHNPVFDVNVFYEKRSVGFFVYQSLDLKDRHSYVNYFQPGVFVKWQMHSTFKARAFFGYIFNQTHGFRDGDSDYYTAVTLYWDPVKHLSVQNTVLFYDYNVKRKLANRLLLAITYPKFKTEIYLWDRTVLEDKKHAISASLALTFPIIRINEKTSVTLTSAYMRYLTSFRPGFALEDGFIFTLAVPIDPLARRGP